MHKINVEFADSKTFLDLFFPCPPRENEFIRIKHDNPNIDGHWKVIEVIHRPSVFPIDSNAGYKIKVKRVV